MLILKRRLHPGKGIVLELRLVVAAAFAGAMQKKQQTEGWSRGLGNEEPVGQGKAAGRVDKRARFEISHGDRHYSR
jgi:hypothetical protein